VQFVHAQKTTWSLQECINAGLENNIAVKIQKLEVKRTQKSRISILNELLPSISLSGRHSYNFGSTINPGTNARVSSNILYDNFSMNAQMNLLDFSAIANSQKSKIGIELAKAEQEIIENEYKLQILESFYQALFTQELVEIQKQQLENTRFNLNRITKEIEIGSKPKSDLYDIQFAFAQEEKQLLETIQLFEIQISQLFQLLNYSEAVKTDIKLDNTFAEIQSNQSEVIHPKIKWAQLYFKSAKNELKAQQAQK
jgi:outer membrane protein